MRRLRLVPLLLAGLGLAGCGEADRPDDIVDPARGEGVPRIVAAEEALAGVHVPTLDPATMNRAEIDKALGAQTLCVFRYTGTGRPVLATAFEDAGPPVRGVVKLGGDLVLLEAAAGEDGAQYRLEGGALRIGGSPPEGEDRRAEMTLAGCEALHAGYGGYHDCAE
jgi:hypothetical protein